MTREVLMKREEASWAGFVEAVGTVPSDERETQGPVPGWSTHDLVWHVAFWSDYAGNVIERIHKGDPNPEDDDADVDEIVKAGRSLTWDEVISRAEDGRVRVRAALEMFESDLPQRAVEWVESDTIHHYDEHAAQIRSFVS